MKFLLLGDGEWAASTLRLLHTNGHRPVGVVLRVQPSDDSLASAASELGCEVLQPDNINDRATLWHLHELRADVGISVSYNQILQRQVLYAFPEGVINLHAGKLPLYRGRNVINWAILNGEEEIGITAHQVDEGIDTGDIIHQTIVPILWTDTYADVLAKVVAALPPVALDAINMVEQCTARPRPQMSSQGTYFPARETPDEWLDWTESSRDLYNKIRSITRPGPGARTCLGETELRIWKASYDPSWPRYRGACGRVVGRRADGVLVKTGDSTLFLHETQVVGELPLVPRWKIGTRLGPNLVEHVRRLEARLSALEQALVAPRHPVRSC